MLERARELHRDGDLEAALAAYGNVIEHSDDGASIGTAWNNTCVIHLNLGDFLQARDACEAALLERRIHQEPRALARTLNNLALVYQNLGDYEQAERYYRDALALNRDRGDMEAVAINLSNLGLLATLAGAYSRAFAIYSEATEIASAHPQEDWAHRQQALAMLNQAVALERLGAYSEALKKLREVEMLRESLTAREVATLLVNTGVVLRNLGDPVQALASYREAMPRFKALGDRAGLANVQINTGIVRYQDLADPGGAAADLAAALSTARQTGDLNEQMAALYHLGRVRLALDDPEGAHQTFSRCLALAQEAASAEGRWSALEGLGRTARAQGQSDKALDRFLSAMEVIESVRADLGSSALRAGFFAERRPTYEAAVVILAERALLRRDMDDARRALAIVQRARARELVDALGTAPVVDGEMKVTNAGDLLIEYFVAEGELFRWVLDRHGLSDFQARGPIAPLAAQVRRLHGGLARGGPLPERSLEAVSTALLGDLPDSILPGAYADARVPQWLVVPDGVLYRVPFDLLLLPGVHPREMLIDRVASALLPSAAMLAKQPRSASGAPALGWVGVAAPGRSAGETPSLASRALPSIGLAPLPAAREELARIGSWVRGRTRQLTGSAATEANLRELLGEGADIVHIATHAVMAERYGAAAAIVLAPDGYDDGLLEPREIVTLRGAHSLTVLAACRTAADLGTGPSALGTLTGAFLAAGSDAVLATLWDVDDAITAAFMEQFYFQLSRGRSPAEALRLAKLRFREQSQFAAAWMWSGYQLAGAGRQRPTLEIQLGGAGRGQGVLVRSLRVAGAMLALAAALIVVAVWPAHRRHRAP